MSAKYFSWKNQKDQLFSSKSKIFTFSQVKLVFCEKKPVSLAPNSVTQGLSLQTNIILQYATEALYSHIPFHYLE